MPKRGLATICLKQFCCMGRMRCNAGCSKMLEVDSHQQAALKISAQALAIRNSKRTISWSCRPNANSIRTKDQGGPCIYIHHWLLDLCNRFYHENP